MEMETRSRPVDWIRDSEKSLSNRLSRHPGKEQMPIQRICARLASLLLERLPSNLAQEMLAMLPNDQQENLHALHQSAKAETDASIGYPTFVEHAASALGKTESDETIREIADAFLWGVVEELPGDFKARLTEVLPAELKSRMDLFSERENESKVA
jgi:hypothetical protein